MADAFRYAVFLDYHKSEEDLARRIASRLLEANLRVYFEPECNTSDAIDQALNLSRSLIIIISTNLLKDGWASYERRTAEFRDPKNSRRRFVPVLADDCSSHLPTSISKYKFIDYNAHGEKAVQELVNACRAASQLPAKGKEGKGLKILRKSFDIAGSGDVVDMVEAPDGRYIYFASSATIEHYDTQSHDYKRNFLGFDGPIKCLSISPNGRKLAVGLDNSEIHILGLEGRTTRVKTPRKHEGSVVTVEWIDNERIVSGAADEYLRIWESVTGAQLTQLRDHSAGIGQVIVTPDGSRAITASYDKTIKIWDLPSYSCIKTLEGHGSAVNSVAILQEATHLLSGSDDCTVRLWNLESGNCVAVMEGHYDTIWRVHCSPIHGIAVSGGWDHTIRIWDSWRGIRLQKIKYRDIVNFSKFSNDGLRIYLGVGSTLHAYRVNRNKVEQVSSLPTDTRRYSNAKVVLVGESMVGKSCLATRLVENTWSVGESTHGMRVWPLQLEGLKSGETEREVWLWDLAGQPEYRLVHQLFLNETALALILFDPSDPADPFRGIGHWEKALRQAVKQDAKRILVATKADRSKLQVKLSKVEELIRNRGYCGFVVTSARTGQGREELLAAINDHIPWDRTPWITTPRLFKILKNIIVDIKSHGLVMIQFAALRQQVFLSLPGERFDETDLRTVVRLLSGQGLIRPLKFGNIILLMPDVLNNYASAVVQAARDHVEGIGCIAEQRVLDGMFDFQDMERLSKPDEDILLRAVVQTFLDESLCIRQETCDGEQLVFPSQFNREYEVPQHPTALVTYRFAGNVLEIYTTLVVRLRYTEGFEEPELWKNAAVFRTHDGYKLGFAIQTEPDGSGKLDLFFEAGVADHARVTLIKYTHEHINRHAINIERQRHYVCINKACGRPFRELEAIKVRMNSGIGHVTCSYCDTQIPFNDLIEQKFRDDRMEQAVREMDQKASINLDNESKELALVGHAFSVAAEAGHIFRPIPNSDHGIDGEIEFKTKGGEASGRRIYLQLKSGDSYTYHRSNDGVDVFTVKKERHLRYWAAHAYPVYLVVRTSSGHVNWMNITDYLNNRADKNSLRIVFLGEEFTPFSLMKLANTLLP